MYFVFLVENKELPEGSRKKSSSPSGPTTKALVDETLVEELFLRLPLLRIEYFFICLYYAGAYRKYSSEEGTSFKPYYGTNPVDWIYELYHISKKSLQ